MDPADLALFNEHDREDREEEEEESLVSWIVKPEYMTADFREETLYGAPRHWSQPSTQFRDESMLLVT